MLKMYQQQASSGSTAAYWDENWSRAELAQLFADVRICENDPVFELLKEKLRPDGLFLEGGCGQAQWVKYFADRGYRAVGIDFAEKTVERVRRVAPELDVRVGNIMALPFADGEVHSYYSGGVVEHIEGGPEAALREARRVLRPDGWFLCSVPDDSFLRRRLFRRAQTDRFDLEPQLSVRRVERTEEEPGSSQLEFFQYAFTEPEFTRLLDDAGFSVERTFGYSLVWGLMELPRFGALYRGAFAMASGLRDRLRGRNGGHSDDAARATAAATAPGHVEPATAAPAAGSRSGDFLRRALVKEDRQTPLVGPLIGLLCEYGANMRMFVARPR
jgi:SAM-dependent methyltransferase